MSPARHFLLWLVLLAAFVVTSGAVSGGFFVLMLIVAGFGGTRFADWLTRQ